MKLLALLLVWCCSMPVLASCSSPVFLFGDDDDDYEKLAPWTAVRWRENVVAEVEVEGHFFELVAIEGVKGDDVIRYCKETWPHIWQKRFEEDLVWALARMGKKVGAKVTLDLIDSASNRKVRKADVAMTNENRQLLWQAASDRARIEEKGP